MTSPSSDYAVMRLSTDPVPLRDRMAMAREVFGREILNLELEPDPEVDLRVDFRLRALPGLKVVTGSASGVRSRRTGAMLADGNDDLFLSINETDRFAMGQRGREAVLNGGEALLVACAEPVWFRRSSGYATGISVPRSAFAHLAGPIEDRTGRVIPQHSEPLKLLRGYVKTLDQNGALTTPALRHAVASHIHDLLVLIVDPVNAAAGGGLKAARLEAIKTFIAAHLEGDGLSVASAAAAHGLTERYVQRLFEAEGTTFSTFVSHQRLARAHRLLRDPRQRSRPVGAIAYDCGFGDISHFNRAFRRLYGLTPSDLRRPAQE